MSRLNSWITLPKFWQLDGKIGVRKIIEWFSLFRTIIVNLAMLAGIIALVLLLRSELKQSHVVIEPINMPSEMTNRGLSGSVAAQRIWDGLTIIQKDVDTLKKHAEVITSGRQLEMVEPNTGVSLQSLSLMFRTLFNKPQIRIGGDVICGSKDCKENDITLRLRVFSPKGLIIRDLPFVQGNDTEDVFYQAALETLAQIDPYVAAIYFMDAGEFQSKSRPIIDEMIKDDHPDAYSGLNLIGNFHVQNGEFLQAKEHFEHAIRIIEARGLNEGQPYNGLGNAFLDLNNPQEALKNYKISEKHLPNDFFPIAGQGDAYYDLEDFEAALNAYDKVVEMAPNALDGHEGRAKTLSALGRLEEANQAIKRAVEINPKDAILFDNWGLILLDQEKYAEAAKKFEQATLLDDQDPYPLVGWADALTALGVYDAAIEKLEQAEALSDGLPEVHTAWGNALASLEQYPQAFEQFALALDLGPDTTEARLGWLNAMLGFIETDDPNKCQLIKTETEYFKDYAGEVVNSDPDFALIENKVLECSR